MSGEALFPGRGEIDQLNRVCLSSQAMLIPSDRIPDLSAAGSAE